MNRRKIFRGQYLCFYVTVLDEWHYHDYQNRSLTRRSYLQKGKIQLVIGWDESRSRIRDEELRTVKTDVTTPPSPHRPVRFALSDSLASTSSFLVQRTIIYAFSLDSTILTHESKKYQSIEVALYFNTIELLQTFRLYNPIPHSALNLLITKTVIVYDCV